MATESSGGVSEENNRILDEMNFSRLMKASALAEAHLAFARPGVQSKDLTPDERASAIIAAHPWFLAARALYFGGCPRCGAAPGEITNLGGDRRECPDCGHRFEFREEG
jgi:hypothetical protein